MLPVIVPAEPDENEKRHDLLLKLRNDKFNDQLSALVYTLLLLLFLENLI